MSVSEAVVFRSALVGVPARRARSAAVSTPGNTSVSAVGCTGHARNHTGQMLLRSPRLRYGPPFGAGVWATGYVVLPALGVYHPIWEYDLTTLGKDLSAHLVFGLGTAAAFRVLP